MSIRTTVFVKEQGVPPDIERDQYDEKSQHVLGILQGNCMATGRLLPDGHIGRVAVLAEHRGRGFGRQIMQHLIALAAVNGHSFVELSAQVHALPFYAMLGFSEVGSRFDEAGLPHQAMRRHLL